MSMGTERWGFLFSVMSSPVVYFLTTLLAVCPNINPTMLCAHVCDVNYAVCYLSLTACESCTSEENRKELSTYGKNYLPILFNIYTTEPKEGDPDKLPILETIRTYLTITDHKVHKFFKLPVYGTFYLGKLMYFLSKQTHSPPIP